jgi:hypothetical protein
VQSFSLPRRHAHGIVINEAVSGGGCEQRPAHFSLPVRYFRHSSSSSRFIIKVRLLSCRMTTPSKNSIDFLPLHASERRRVRLKYRDECVPPAEHERLSKAPFVLLDRNLAWNLIPSLVKFQKIAVRARSIRPSRRTSALSSPSKYAQE